LFFYTDKCIAWSMSSFMSIMVHVYVLVDCEPWKYFLFLNINYE